MSDAATSSGRVVAFDPGAVRIGVAVCASDRSMAFPLAPVPAGPQAADRCAAIVAEESATAVVVGLPLHLDGTSGDAAASAREFANEVRRALGTTGVEVLLVDERLTTVTAAARLRDAGITSRGARQRIDSAAAVVLLESWLAR